MFQETATMKEIKDDRNSQHHDSLSFVMTPHEIPDYKKLYKLFTEEEQNESLQVFKRILNNYHSCKIPHSFIH